MNGRQKHRRREIVIPTVTEARRTEKKREKSKDNNDQIVLRLKIIGDSRLAAVVDREKVVRHIGDFAEGKKLFVFFGSAKPFKALHWIAEEAFRLIRIEEDPSVLYWLLRLVIDFQGYLTYHFAEFKDGNTTRLGLHVLAQKPEARIRVTILSMITGDVSAEESNTVARLCYGVLTNFIARKGRLTTEPIKYDQHEASTKQWEDEEVRKSVCRLSELVEWRYQGLRDIMAELCRNRAVLTLLYEVAGINPGSHPICGTAGQYGAMQCITYLLRRSSRNDRAFLIANCDITTAFMALESNFLLTALYHDDVAQYFAYDTALLNMLYRRLTRSDEDHDYDIRDINMRTTSMVAARMLDYGLQHGDAQLQRMLGMGFLESARFLAASNHEVDAREARIFRRVLAARPEWKERFRVMTDRENPLSHTARLGKTIAARISKRAEYILEDGVVQI